MEAPPPWTDPHAQEGRSEDVHGGCGPDLRITEPADERQRYIIDMLASYVLKDGCDLEQVGSEYPGLCFFIACTRIHASRFAGGSEFGCYMAIEKSPVKWYSLI